MAEGTCYAKIVRRDGIARPAAADDLGDTRRSLAPMLAATNGIDGLTILWNLSLISATLVVKARTAMISLATVKSKAVCRVFPYSSSVVGIPQWTPFGVGDMCSRN